MKYTHWLIYIKPEYRLSLPPYYLSSNSHLYAYTDDKKLLNEFFHIRKKECFIVIKKKLTKEEVNLLALNYQNNMLEEISLYIKGGDTVDMCLTGKEYICIDNKGNLAVTTQLQSLTFPKLEKFKQVYFDAFSTLEYLSVHESLDTGDYGSIYLDVDLIGTYAFLFKTILR